MFYKIKRMKSQRLYTLFHYNTWRIQSQILCFAILLLSLITALVYLSTFLLLNYTIKTLKTLSEQSLSAENRRQIQRFTQLQAFSSQQYIIQHSYQLHIINDIFLFNQEHNVETIEPPPCLNETAITDKYALSSCFCYSYFGNGVIENAYSDSQMKKLSTILAEYLLEFALTGPLYYSTISSDQFFAIYNISVKPTFKPSQRQWYVDHLAHMKSGNEIIMSDPYFSALNVVHVAFSHNLSNLNEELLGIVAEDSDFEVMPKFKDDNIKVSMVDSKDQLIISRLYQFDVSTIFQIYDYELTGISKSEWENMKSEADENGNFLTTDDVVDQEYLVSIFRIENPLIYIVLEVDNHIYRNSNLNLIHKYEEFQANYNLQSTCYLLLYIILCLLCQFLFIKWLQRDLNTLRFIAYKTAYQDYFKFHQKISIAQTNHTIHQLQLAFLRIIDNSAGKKTKNHICYKLENVQYPLRPYMKMKKLIKSLKIETQQTVDFNDNSKEFPIQSILREWARTIKKQKKTIVLTIDPPLD